MFLNWIRSLPPCHYGFQCYVADGELSLMWNQRSADLFLGVPFNISSYGLLLLLLCETTGLKPGTLIGSLGDTHLYKDHIAAAKTQITREQHALPNSKVVKRRHIKRRVRRRANRLRTRTCYQSTVK